MTPGPRPTHVVRKRQCGAGVTPCGAPARLYPAGWRCDDHTPARAAGRAEAPESPPPPLVRNV